ncbi:MAG: hypothetical protein QXI68_03740 [Sulfolobales archaeon]
MRKMEADSAEITDAIQAAPSGRSDMMRTKMAAEMSAIDASQLSANDVIDLSLESVEPKNPITDGAIKIRNVGSYSFSE